MAALTSAAPTGVKSDLGLATLFFAQMDLRDGIREDLGRNDGYRIRQYAKAFGLKPPINWCAVSFSAWLRNASKLCRIEAPVAGSPAARGVEGQFIEAGLFVPKNQLTEDVLVPGNIPIWWRGKSIEDWPGHIGVIESFDGINMYVVEANSGRTGTEVARMTRSIMAPKFVGVGVLRGQLLRHEFHEPTDAELERAGQLVRLERELLLYGEPDDPLADLNARLEREKFDDGDSD
jgi:hypothetical protein